MEELKMRKIRGKARISEPDPFIREEPMSKWQIAVDPAFSVRGVPAKTDGNMTIFGSYHFKDGLDDRLDTVAHEFRHTMPANQSLYSSSCIVNGNCAMERDAINWAARFWKPR
jgi:hypothetical protein